MTWGGGELEALGADAPAVASGRLERAARAVPPAPVILGAAAVGALVGGTHPVLGALGAAALVGNVRAALADEVTWHSAVTRLGKHVVASAGSLALQSHPVIGYVAGAFAAELFVDATGRWDVDVLEIVPASRSAAEART